MRGQPRSGFSREIRLSNILDDMDRMVDINTRIAARVRVLRAAADLSLEALARRCDVSRSMLSLVERGETSPTAVVLEKIATGLGVPLASSTAPPVPAEF